MKRINEVLKQSLVIKKIQEITDAWKKYYNTTQNGGKNSSLSMVQ